MVINWKTINPLMWSTPPQAIRFLHECGVLLYYSDFQTKLSELYFLNPEWLCMLMAQIVTIPEINPFISKEGVSGRRSIVVSVIMSRLPSITAWFKVYP